MLAHRSTLSRTGGLPCLDLFNQSSILFRSQMETTTFLSYSYTPTWTPFLCKHRTLALRNGTRLHDIYSIAVKTHCFQQPLLSSSISNGARGLSSCIEDRSPDSSSSLPYYFLVTPCRTAIVTTHLPAHLRSGACPTPNLFRGTSTSGQQAVFRASTWACWLTNALLYCTSVSLPRWMKDDRLAGCIS